MKTAELSWQEGQPVSCEFEDVYFSRHNGQAETEHVFLAANDLPAAWQNKSRFVIAETGFGSGLNFLTTVKHWLNTTQPEQQLFYYSVELFPFSRDDLQQAVSAWPELNSLADELLKQYPAPLKGFHLLHLCERRVSLCLMFGDVLDCLSQCQAQVDVWYLDGFSPSKNPEMWNQDVFAQISRLSKKQTRLSTFTVAGFVRRGLQSVGFSMNKVRGFAQKRQMLVGVMEQPIGVQMQRPWFHYPEFSVQVKKALIIGAGIAGLTTAWSLIQRGWQVKIIEQNDSLGSQASGNPLGLVMPRLGMQPSTDIEFYQTAFLYAVAQLNQWQAAGFEGWQQSGVLQLLRNTRQQQLLKLPAIEGFAEALTATRASELSGVSIADDAIWFPQAGYCSPRALCDYLYSIMADRLDIVFNTEITHIEQRQQQWQLFSGDDVVDTTETLVLANAYQAKQFAASHYLDIQPARGQINLLPETAGSCHLSCPLIYEGYLMPSQDNQHVVGASFILGNRNSELRLDEQQHNLQQLQAALPGVFTEQTRPLDGRASVRAVSRDRLPFLGPLADRAVIVKQYAELYKGRPAEYYPQAEYYSGLFVNLAHGARGFVSSFICGEIIGAQLNNEPYPVSSNVFQALHPSRSIIKQIKKKHI